MIAFNPNRLQKNPHATQMNGEELRRLIDETAASAMNWHILAMQLQRPSAGPDDPVLAFVAAFHYMLYPITEESGREAWGPFAPVFEGPNGVFPPPLPKVEDRWLTLWAEVGQACTNPVVRSRLHDLLWERRSGARPDTCRVSTVSIVGDKSAPSNTGRAESRPP